ncbi:MAG: metallophosphoesterase family protein [Pirellulales bacterium]
MTFQFIHTADLHIDSPLRGLAANDLEVHTRLQAATRSAFENVVNIAIEQQVAFVLIAGDLFDGSWRDMKTGQWTAAQFRRLQRESINVYYIRGNHDAESIVRKTISWPDNVCELSVKKPETQIIEEYKVAIHGQGFKERELLDDIAANYPEAVKGYFNVAMLHTSLTGCEGHDKYAPTSVEVLKSKGYDYWALGHIHIRSETPICEDPYIAYSGNTQGRQIKEKGAKGCNVITVENGSITAVDFHETDLLRWHELTIELAEEDHFDSALDKTRRELTRAHSLSNGRFSAVRLVYQGRCQAHRQLGDSLMRSDILLRLHELAASIDEDLWIEKIKIETKPVLSLEQRRQSSDMLGQLLHEVELVRKDTDGVSELTQMIQPVLDKCESAGAKLQFDADAETQIRQWLDQAELLLLANLEDAS